MLGTCDKSHYWFIQLEFKGIAVVGARFPRPIPKQISAIYSETRKYVNLCTTNY